MRHNAMSCWKGPKTRMPASVTFTVMLAAGTFGGALVARGTSPLASGAESAAHACEHNRCAAGKMCVDSESAPVATQCDAIGRRGECVTLPCGANAAIIRNLLRFRSSESGDRLVAMGPVAANALLGYAGLPEPYAARSLAMKTLARMVEAWQATSFDEQDWNRLHELAQLYLGPLPSHVGLDERVSVAAGAIDLALALNDPELRIIVERIASSLEDARERLGRQVDYGRLTEHARSRLGLSPMPGTA